MRDRASTRQDEVLGDDSHIIHAKPGHIATLSVPDHPEVARGTLRSLLARAGVSLAEFLEALDEQLHYSMGDKEVP